MKKAVIKPSFRVKAKPLTAEEKRRLERDVAILSSLSTEELKARSKSMTATQRNQWKQARKGRPRKSAGEKAARVLFTIEPALLQEADRYARIHGLTRAQLIASGLRHLMSA